VSQMSRTVSANAGFICDKAAVLGAMMNETFCITLCLILKDEFGICIFILGYNSSFSEHLCGRVAAFNSYFLRTYLKNRMTTAHFFWVLVLTF
jgi:hypothetical protein